MCAGLLTPPYRKKSRRTSIETLGDLESQGDSRDPGLVPPKEEPRVVTVDRRLEVLPEVEAERLREGKGTVQLLRQ